MYLRLQKPVAFLMGVLPFLWLLWRALFSGLGVNPVEAATHHTGAWTLRFLLAGLAVSPLQYFFPGFCLQRLRRMIGLFAFFYACLHVLAYVVLDQFFAWKAILRDLTERPFIAVGMASFASLVPLAITSTGKMRRRLGRRWRQLHRLVYVAAIGGVMHYLWLVKADFRQPLVYAGVLTVLLAWRVHPVRQLIESTYLRITRKNT